MRARTAILATAVVVVAVAAVVVILMSNGSGGTNALKQLQQRRPVHKLPPIPGAPSVNVIAPRNGSRQTSGAVVVRVVIHNFTLSPQHFGRQPQLGEGYIRYQLHRVPDCVAPKRLRRALKNPLSTGRLLGASFDYPQYSGANGLLAQRLGVAGSYSPGTRPVIYYHDLPSGFYHIVINLAENDGTLTPFHGVTNFQILPPPGRGGPGRCKRGKIPSSRAEAAFQ